jgi:hypothetical protein
LLNFIRLKTDEIFKKFPSIGGANIAHWKWAILGVVILFVVSNFQNAKHFPSRFQREMPSLWEGVFLRSPKATGGVDFIRHWRIKFEKIPLSSPLATSKRGFPSAEPTGCRRSRRGGRPNGSRAVVGASASLARNVDCEAFPLPLPAGDAFPLGRHFF